MAARWFFNTRGYQWNRQHREKLLTLLRHSEQIGVFSPGFPLHFTRNNRRCWQIWTLLCALCYFSQQLSHFGSFGNQVRVTVTTYSNAKLIPIRVWIPYRFEHFFCHYISGAAEVWGSFPPISYGIKRKLSTGGSAQFCLFCHSYKIWGSSKNCCIEQLSKSQFFFILCNLFSNFCFLSFGAIIFQLERNSVPSWHYHVTWSHHFSHDSQKPAEQSNGRSSHFSG